MRERWRSMLAGAVVLSALCGLVVAAFFADGRAVSDAQTNDGGAWLVNRSLSSVGHVNRAVGEVSMAANPFSGAFDVEQADGLVVVHDIGASEAVLLDTQFAQKGPAVSVTETTEVRTAKDTVVLHDWATGELWRLAREEFTAVETLADQPVSLQAAPNGLFAVGVDGSVAVTDVSQRSVHVLAGDVEPKVVPVPVWGDAGVLDVTLVGNVVVVALDDERIVIVDGEDSQAFDLGSPVAALQQPTGDGSEVVVVLTSGDVVRVDLETGDLNVVETLGGSSPLPPIDHDGCVWTVTVEPEPTLQRCGQTKRLPGAGSQLKLVLVNDWVWVNDVESGGVYFVREQNDDELEFISDWSTAFSPEAGEQDNTTDEGGEENLVENANAEEQNADLVDGLDEDDQNTPPVAVDDTAEIRRTRTVYVDVLRNDFDEDNDPLRVVGVSAVGSSPSVPETDLHVDVTADGQGVQVRPPVDFVGIVTFEYEISDGRGETARADVAVTVTELDQASNQPPVANIDNATVRRGRSVSVNVLRNDEDPDGDTLVLLSVGGEGEDDTVTHAPDGQVTFTPAVTSTDGTVNLNYTVADDYGLEDTGTLRIQVRLEESNLTPVARNDVGRTAVGTPVVLRVLDNDMDPDGDPLSAQSLQTSDGQATTAQLTADGRFLFRPEAAGTYRFTYTASDGSEVDQAQIRVDVEAPLENRPPVAVVDEVALAIGESRLVRVLDNDGDPDGDVVGIVDMVGVAGLEIVEVPGIGFNVLATPTAEPRSEFRYWISDGVAEPVMGTVIVSALQRPPVDYPPFAVADVIDVRPGQTAVVPVLANDYDPEGRGLRLVGPVDTPEASGSSARISPDEQVILLFVEEGQQFGFDFGYNVQDPAGNQASAIVTVRIVPPTQVNRPPVAGPDIARTTAGTPVVIGVLDNDIDPDGDPIAIEGIAEQPQHGTLEQRPDGTFVYTPLEDFAGTDRFVYTVVDGYQAPPDSVLPEEQRGPGRSRGEVLIGVMPPGSINRDPVAVDDQGFADIPVGGSPVQLGVLENDYDPDGDRPLIVTDATEPQVGSVRVVDNRFVEYTPPTAFDGESREVSFTYSIADGRDGTASAQVFLRLETELEPVPPVAVDDTIGPARPGDPLTFDPRDNDFDPDGRTVDLQVIAQHPAITVNADGTVTVITPETTGDLPYAVRDLDGNESQTAFITVQVAENRPPEVSQVAVTTPYNTPVEIELGDYVSDPDGDPLTITLAGPRSNGSVAVVAAPAANSLRVSFTPDTDFSGVGTFVFTADDLEGHVVQGTARITVEPSGNEPPVASPTEVTVEAGIDGFVRLTELVTDPDGPEGADLHSYSISGPAQGNVTLEERSDGEVVIRSAITDGGVTDSFTYTVDDDGEHTVSNTVTIVVVDPSFPAPSLTDDSARTLQGEATAAIAVLDNDINNVPAELRDGGLEIVTVGVSPGGQVEQVGDTFVFTPNTDFFGQASFTYTVQDDRRSADFETTATVVVDVVGRPAQPQPPSIGGRGADYLVVNWAAPTGDAARGPVEGYELNFTSSAGSGTITIDSPTTTFTHEGLTPGAEYCYSVAAVNEAGTGDFSASPGTSECGIPNERPGIPPAPVVEFGDGQLSLTWGEAPNNGSEITDYEVRISGGASGTASGGLDLTHTWAGLVNGTDYIFEVRAVNDEGEGPWSAPSAAENPLTSPAAPLAVTAERGDRQVLVTWAAPADNGGDAITEYEIRSPQLGGAWVSAGAPQGATNTYTWTAIPNGTDVNFEVRAINRDPDPGAPGASPTVRTCAVPDAPAVTSVDRGDREVTVSWGTPDAQGCAITEYRIEADNGAGTQTAAATANSHVFTGLTNGQAYNFRVAAINEVVTVDGDAPQFSAQAGPVIPAGPPLPAPTLTAATANGVRRVQLTWTAAGDNGDPVTDYQISVNSGGWTSVGNTLSHEYVAGADGTTYSFRVRAVNGVGSSDPSNSLSATTWSAPGTPSVTASASTGTVSASWNVPSNGGTGITQHQAKRITGSDCAGAGSTVNNPGTSESWSSSNGTTYRVCVRYRNAVGWGSWGRSNAVTPPPPPRVVSIGWGTEGAAQGQPNCSSASCSYIIINISGFAPNQTFTRQCQGTSNGGSAFSTFFTGSISTNAAGNGNNGTCYWGFPNESVRVVVDGVVSNVITRS